MSRRSFAAQAFTQLNAYIALVALLLVFDLVLATRLVVAWHDSHSDQSAQYNTDLATYAQLQAQASHLQALPVQLSNSRKQADAFIMTRIPLSNSAMLTELGTLTNRDHVRLSGASYASAPAIPGLVEWRINASVAGEYASVVHFINDVERDKEHAFFIVRSITLTGQQGGLVNLRVRLTTYMRADAANAAVLQSGSRSPGAEGSGGNASEEVQ